MPESSRLRTLGLPPSQLVAGACRYIAQHHAAQGRDLTRLTLLIPHLQAGAAVARALRAATGAEVLLLPRITTLASWAQDIPVEASVMSGAAREAMLHQVLSQRGWFAQADLWAIAGELNGLLDELTRWRVGMPDSIADFQRRIEAAYRARAGASFAFEAKLVYELWHAATRSAGSLDVEGAYRLRLGKLAGALRDPLYAIGLGRLTPAENEFFERCAARIEVTCFVAESEPSAHSCAAERALALAWPALLTRTLHERAAELRQADRSSALRARLRLFGAHGVEQEAQAVDLAIREWLVQGRQRIAAVVFDRLTARRARALLERAQVLVRDEAGWALSTTSAATVLSRLFDALGNDCYHRDLLDLLKSPFALADWPRAARQQAVWRLERRIREASVRCGLERYLRLAEKTGDAELKQLLVRVQRAGRMLALDRRKSLPAWLEAVEHSARALGVHAGLEHDAAGAQLLELMRSLGSELAGASYAVSFGEFRRWWSRRLEAATFRDAAIDSPVIFTSLPAARLRAFDAVLVIGADAAHLPGPASAEMFFNQSVRRELGLPGRAERVRALEEDLLGLIANAGEVLVTWQRTRDGEPNLLSPLFERLHALHQLAWQDSLIDTHLPALLAAQAAGRAADASALQSTPPAPRVPAAAVPDAVSASGYNALMACPYQFFARYVLGLRALEDVQEALDKAGYGSRIHEALYRFHATHPRVSDRDSASAQAELDGLSQAVFADLIADNYVASAWLARWQAVIPGYLQWQREREAQGWRFHAGELERAITIATPAGRTLRLHGRIDRVDMHADGAVAVVDYKTQARTKLRGKLRIDGEDVQLPLYALLWGGPIAAALFLGLDAPVDGVACEGDIDALARAVAERLGQLFDRIHEDASLPAHGVEAVCRHCDVSGLCRRKYWA
ncbi:MAG: PD-(D/E)XK nuclease family protein [Burkholderiales bacterium]|nr:PD-(D/E)XK nuclease family protein [Burkholderiales bacterium]